MIEAEARAQWIVREPEPEEEPCSWAQIAKVVRIVAIERSEPDRIGLEQFANLLDGIAALEASAARSHS